MCSSRKEEMKMGYLYGHSLGWRAHSEASCRGNYLCAAVFAAPQKETNSSKDVAGCILSPLHLR